MRKPTDIEKSIKVTLYRIASMSPRHERIGYYPDITGEPHKNTKNLSGEWDSSEAHFVWCIYERAIFDYFGMGTAKKGFGKNPIFRNDTAETGLIKMPQGKHVNILELLGLDAAWCWAQIQKAYSYSTLKAAA